MTRLVFLTVVVSLLVTATAFADSINTGLYDPLTDTWTYTITIDPARAALTEFMRISVDPATDRSMYDQVTVPAGWVETTNAALGAYNQPFVGGTLTTASYKYLEWMNASDQWGDFTFSFRDNPADSMNLKDNQGPLVYTLPEYEYSYSSMLLNHHPEPTVYVTGRAGYHNPVVPEPGTMALLTMGVGALGCVVRRKRATQAA
jgi:hypothetical protein